MPRASGAARKLQDPPEDGPPAENEVTSQPGEQGIATQPEDEKKEGPAKVWERTTSQQEIAFSHDEVTRLKDDSADMGAEAVVDALIRVVDVHPSYQMPVEWPGKPEEVLTRAPLLEQIGAFLCRGCPRIEISPSDVVWLWRNKKSWTESGVQVFVQARKLGELATYFAGGGKAVIIGNFQLFRLMTTRQKVAQLYKALRTLDTAGSKKPPQFAGYFDEIALFGTGTSQSDLLLERAIEQGSQRELPFAESVDAFTASAALDPDKKSREDEGRNGEGSGDEDED